MAVDLHALDQPAQGGTAPNAAPSSPGSASAPKPAPHGTHGKPPAKKAETAHRKQEVHRAAPQAPTAQAPPPPSGPQAPHAPAPAVVAKPNVPPATAPPAPVLPSGPPPQVRLSPVEPPIPTVKQTPSPPPVVAADAPGTVARTSDGLRLTFGEGRVELNPDTEAAIKDFARKAPKTDTASINVLAFAAGSPDDPSTARRLSLSRGLAVRSVLMAEGVDSTRIYVRALGAAAGDAPPDRVDLAVMGTNASTAQAGAPK